MIEVFPNLYVGSLEDEQRLRKANGTPHDGWAVVSACRDPYHRQALGYTGRGAPKDSPEYLVAHRERRVILNLLDAEDVAYIPDQIMHDAVSFIDANIHDAKVLVHCNKGLSRSPTIALLYLARHTHFFRPGTPHNIAEHEFRTVYPTYAPSNGMREYVQRRFEREIV